jgi:hypothetical protein
MATPRAFGLRFGSGVGWGLVDYDGWVEKCSISVVLNTTAATPANTQLELVCQTHLEHVRAAAERRHRPVAVLGHLAARRRDDHARARADVDRSDAVSAGADDVDDWGDETVG